MDNIKTRCFRFLLYPDNKDHMRTFKIIQRSSTFRNCYCGIWHDRGCGKKHAHILLSFENGRSWHQLCKDTLCSERFCRPIGYEPDKKNPSSWRRCPKKDNWIKACAYLPHFTDLDKEQYSISDIWGASQIVDNARYNALQYHSRNLSQADCLQAAKVWICSNIGKVITSMMLVSWITNSPYMKIANSSLLRAMIQDHNNSVYAQESRSDGFDLEAARIRYEEREKLKRELEHKEFCRALDAGEIKIDDFEPILF